MAATGRMDLETVVEMSRPRCQNEDKLPGGHIEYSKFFQAPTGGNGTDGGEDDPFWRYKLGPTGEMCRKFGI